MARTDELPLNLLYIRGGRINNLALKYGLFIKVGQPMDPNTVVLEQHLITLQVKANSDPSLALLQHVLQRPTFQHLL